MLLSSSWQCEHDASVVSSEVKRRIRCGSFLRRSQFLAAEKKKKVQPGMFDEDFVMLDEGISFRD